MALYSQDEEQRIVNYLVEKEVIHRIKGDAVWKEMSQDRIVNRTWQSLKQHFRKTIIFELHLPRYELNQQKIELFRHHFSKPVTTAQQREAAMKQSIQAEGQQERKLANFLDTSTSSDSEEEQ